jgi:hypothetical protein
MYILGICWVQAAQLFAQQPPNPYKWNPLYEKDCISALPVPKGYKRVEHEKGSFQFWINQLPLLPPNSKVYLFNGKEKPYQAAAFRIIEIDVEPRDLQQCADAVMRLRAEYLYSKFSYSKIHFNYTNGTKVSFDDWRQGRKPKNTSKGTVFSEKTATPDNSYQNFRKYLTNIFSYAGTASLEKELTKISCKMVQVGDVLIKGGFPGHAVIVVDVVEHPQTKERLVMLAQSYMPAQSVHILKNLKEPNLSPYFRLTDGQEVPTPEWTFPPDCLKRF